VSEFSILIVNDDGFNSPSSSSRIRKKLYLATTFHNTEVKSSLVNCTSTSQKTVVLEDDRIVIAKLLGDTSSFFPTKYDAVASTTLD
jgi:hypothetical protein